MCVYSGFSHLKATVKVRVRSLTQAASSSRPKCQKITGQREYTEEHTGKYIESSCANSHITEEPSGELDLLTTVKLFLGVQKGGVSFSPCPHRQEDGWPQARIDGGVLDR